jgi:hypothetical protein
MVTYVTEKLLAQWALSPDLLAWSRREDEVVSPNGPPLSRGEGAKSGELHPKCEIPALRVLTVEHMFDIILGTSPREQARVLL